MKVYVLEKSVTLSGKSWEILQKLKQLQNRYVYVNDWIADIHDQVPPTPLKRIK
ncbi:Z-ring formation inhibitor MciZ [Peribacillus frigoritolerans]|uniref:Z-ring formation inhibitor MciZ n=1 Tax=Peribacillus TaxID=2675229 RepID=UPI002282E76B|nr:Z-ring formation inhibitor MciZ [Peribacillus frigoritolerans]MCY9004724.1 Z-ring formation inhibitor MciZ [Peribacillus frigoritolerans]MED3995180.1 Z-ring formation inhibitor MciZ [Peribacillus frigoritolerans]MED4633961.1 Z-ring formation inhibitor MciZ [Peribacillus frigoritolerans]